MFAVVAVSVQVCVCMLTTQVSLVDSQMVPILPMSWAQRPIAVAYDDVSHSVYWTDVRQRTINRVALSNHSRHPVINTVYLAPGLYVRLSVCLSVCHNATTTFTPPPADCGRVVAFARGFDFRPFHFHVIILGKLFTHMRFCRQAVELVAVKGR